MGVNLRNEESNNHQLAILIGPGIWLTTYCVEVLYKAVKIKVDLFYSLLIYIVGVAVGSYVCWHLSLPLNFEFLLWNQGDES
ncbi:hypothetical protein NC653_028763 [Populus alba x Populus x berolinensis]|uniref:Uncharacterized protein n=1 Tax=Populus alba x Populus x berolinensis TaxID=444605 RepID=A0AAD6Q3R2_9ROSI|nr:hypothetical protein NC653_028763 [Populus alba x Populus x berolinensis]